MSKEVKAAFILGICSILAAALSAFVTYRISHNTGRLGDFKQLITKKDFYISEQENRIKSLNEAIEILKKNLNNKNIEIVSLNSSIERKTEIIASLNLKIKKIKDDKSKYEKQFKKMDEEIKFQSKFLDRLRRACNTCEKFNNGELLGCQFFEYTLLFENLDSNEVATIIKYLPNTDKYEICRINELSINTDLYHEYCYKYSNGSAELKKDLFNIMKRFGFGYKIIIHGKIIEIRKVSSIN